MEILWFFLGLVLLFLAASCFGMARSSYMFVEERVIGLVFGSSLCLATFFLFIIFAGLRGATAGSMVLLAMLGGWFEKELGSISFRIVAAAIYGRNFNHKAPDK